MKKLYIFTFDNAGETDFDYFVADSSLHTHQLHEEAYKILQDQFGASSMQEVMDWSVKVMEVYPVDEWGNYTIEVKEKV